MKNRVYYRCSYCNHVSSPEIATEPEDFKPGVDFTTDVLDETKIICTECLETSDELTQEYEEDIPMTYGFIND